MKTDAREYMELLKEIQNSTSSTFTSLPTTEPRFIIDSNSREISIPPEFSFLGVQNDHRAETIYFEIDRYFDHEDLSKHTCVVQFINKDSDGINEGIYPITEMDLDTAEGKIVFGWEICNAATQKVGDIVFSIRFYSINEDGDFSYNFNTLPSVSNILKSLNVVNNVVGMFPSEIERWISKIDTFSKEVETARSETLSATQHAADSALSSEEYAERAETAAERAETAADSVLSSEEYAERAEGAAERAETAAERAESAVLGDPSAYIKRTDVAVVGGEAGLIKIAPTSEGNGVNIREGCLSLIGATGAIVEAKSSNRQAVTPKTVDNAVRAGITSNALDLTQPQKEVACAWLGALGLNEMGLIPDSIVGHGCELYHQNITGDGTGDYEYLHEGNIGTLLNIPQIESFSYEGTGGSNEDATIIQFNGVTHVAFVYGKYPSNTIDSLKLAILIKGAKLCPAISISDTGTSITTQFSYALEAVWDDALNRVLLYSDSGVADRLNQQGYTYNVVAISTEV